MAKGKSSKRKTVFVCSECGATFPRWTGKCNVCGTWGSIVEETVSPGTKTQFRLEHSPQVKPITSIKESTDVERITTGIESLDEALGGGLVPGQVILISGEPGIGKSTLLLQIASQMAKQGKKVLYVTGEESSTQVYLRGKRIGALDENILILADTVLENIIEMIKKEKPEFVIVDSVQTVYSEQLESIAGSVSQVREVSGRLTELGKQLSIPIVLVGQVTKEGNIAGPKVLEHIVDTVANFEGERGHAYRVLKFIKNRFGAAGELAVFNMTSKGLKEIKDPSSFFLAEKPVGKPGSIIFPFTEGSKPVLVEIQALVSKTVYAVPQRKAQGVDINRLAIITAILEKELNIFLKDKDIFVNVVGGINIKEPAADLPVAMAILSSALEKPIPQDLAAFGELGLTGEVRSVYYTDLRIKECKKFGINKILVPFSTDINDQSLIKIKHIKDVLDMLK